MLPSTVFLTSKELNQRTQIKRMKLKDFYNWNKKLIKINLII